MKTTNLLTSLVMATMLSGLSATPAKAADNSQIVKPVKRVVVKTPIKKHIVTANSMSPSNKYFATVHGRQQSTGKFIRPELQKGSMPNLYANK